MNKLKTIFVGAGVTLYNIGASATGIFQRCTGVCGSCAGDCLGPAVGLIGIGAFIYFRRRLGKGLTKLKSTVIYYVRKI